ncbi:aminomethyltransferase [Pseudohyphozyma bogoriensis]|nr:aminomethyltransferase [Pseudohyphozyma bogoriensis]
MLATRDLLLQHEEKAGRELLGRLDLENEAYLYTAALTELKIESQVKSRNDGITLRSMTSALQRDTDAVSQRMNEDVQQLRSDIQLDMNNRKEESAMDLKDLEMKIMDLNSKFTVTLGDVRTEVEATKWISTRRVMLAVVGVSFCPIRAPSTCASSFQTRRKTSSCGLPSDALTQASTYFKTLLEGDWEEFKAKMCSKRPKVEVSRPAATGLAGDHHDFDDSDCEADELYTNNLSKLHEDNEGYYKEVRVTSSRYSTYRALLVWIYTGHITFAPLSTSFPRSRADAEDASTTKVSRKVGLSQSISEEPLLPIPVSPKSIYRLAHLVDLPALAQLALNAIKSFITVDNAAQELFGDVSALYPDFSTSLPADIAYRYTPLPTRSVLTLTGNDTTKFLQGLVSNDVRKLSDEERMIYAGVMKADGRMLYDIFISKPPSEGETAVPTLKVDHPAEHSEAIRKYFKRHILRSKVKLVKVPAEGEEDETVFAAWRTEDEATAEELQAAERWLSQSGAGRDTRNGGDELGWRWSAKQSETTPPSELFEQVTPAHHHLLRLQHAIPEGPDDWFQLPLEGNLDIMGGVDYKKGCYVGQELTARTHHKGVVRKRGVVLRLFREGEEVPTSPIPSFGPQQPYPDLFPLPPPHSSLTPLYSSLARPRPSGKIGSSLPLINRAGSSSTLAFGSVRLEHIGDAENDMEGVFVVKVEVEEGGEVGDGKGESEEEGGRWLAKAFVPEWVGRKLQELEEAKNR